MAYFLTTVSHSTTGVKTINVGFQPISARITAGNKTGVADNCARKTTGVTDGTNQICDVEYLDTTSGYTDRFSDRLVSVRERVAGTITEVVRANFDSFTATELKYNVTTANVNFQFLIEVDG